MATDHHSQHVVAPGVGVHDQARVALEETRLPVGREISKVRQKDSLGHRRLHPDGGRGGDDAAHQVELGGGHAGRPGGSAEGAEGAERWEGAEGAEHIATQRWRVFVKTVVVSGLVFEDADSVFDASWTRVTERLA
jgi:hypothetical protein